MKYLATFCASDGIVIGTVPRKEDLEMALCLCPECGSLFHKWQHQRSFNKENLAAVLCDAGFVHCRVFAVDFANCLGFAVGFKDFGYSCVTC